ncbi:MAG: ECF transporter S component [Thermoproteota archaeon]|jgi:energy-coupling factor transport system substrate-specific component|nr:ECF transporter S component [Thermoproteota archaeon]
MEQKTTWTWSTLDVVGLGIVSVIAGVIFWVASVYLWPALAFGTVFAQVSIYGLWFIGATMAAYIIRKPGVAFGGEMLGALIEYILAPIFGPFVLIWGAFQAAAGEAAFGLRRYKKYDYVTMSLAGILAGIVVIIPTYIWYKPLIDDAYNLLGYAGIIIFILMHSLSGAIIAGIGIKIAIDKLALTGILDAFPVAKEVKKIE